MARILVKESENIVETLKSYYEKNPSMMVDIRELPTCQKVDALRYAMTLEDLEDPLMSLNIFNLIKTYNTLDDNYFASEDIYVKSIEELLDVKLALSKDIKELTNKVGYYFLCLLKSYNKMAYTPADVHKALPKFYEHLFLSSDLMTICGMFGKASNIDLKELVYIENAYGYMSAMLLKSMNSLNLLESFYSENEVLLENDNR